VSAQNRFARRVNMEVASHTAFMDPILGELRTALEDLTPESPPSRFYSTVVEGAESPMLDADYWVANVRQPALLSKAVSAAAEEHGTFIEISAHPILTHAVGDTLDPTSHHHSVGVVARRRRQRSASTTNLNTVHTSHPPQIPHPVEPHPLLPTTPWHHGHHWVNPRPIAPVRHVAAVGDPGVQTDGPIPSEWYCQLTWPAANCPRAKDDADISWLVITDSELGSEIGQRPRRRNSPPLLSRRHCWPKAPTRRRSPHSLAVSDPRALRARGDRRPVRCRGGIRVFQRRTTADRVPSPRWAWRRGCICSPQRPAGQRKATGANPAHAGVVGSGPHARTRAPRILGPRHRYRRVGA